MKYVLSVIFAFFIALCGTVTAFAASSNSYVYDSDDAAVAVPAPYSAARYMSGAFGGKPLSAPKDLYVRDGKIYILDSGNHRVVVLNEEFTFQKEITFRLDGKPLTFGDAQGLFVTSDQTLYIADKAAMTVYVAEQSGNIKGNILSPPADKVDADFEFTPTSVVVDTAGIIYIISSGSYAGALQYDEEYRFLGFYGNEQVTVTARVLMNEFWKKILSEEAASGLTRNVPTSIISLDIDADNFIYTLRGGSSATSTGQIRKLNTLGGNILLDQNGLAGTFGDLDTYYDSAKNLTVASSLCDLTVDEQGFLTALDRTYNRLFQYSSSARLLYAFGGSEARKGNFSSPVAIDTIGDRLLVLDDAENALTVLEPTDFANDVRRAVSLCEDGLFLEARPYLEQVLKADVYYELANGGMGTVCEESGLYKEAMKYYQLASDKEGYSSAFSKQRNVWMKAHFAVLVFAVLLVLAFAVFAVSYAERHRKSVYETHLSAAGYPLYCLKHPFRAYYELKINKKGSVWLANGILVVLFFLSILYERVTSFHFSHSNPEDFNVFLIFGKTIGLFLLFILCNWAVSTLADGEGTFREIWICAAYALQPLCITLAVMTGISHILSLEESAFWSVFWVLGILWTAIHLFMAVREAHQYTTGRTLLILGASLLGIYLLILIITLGYSLFTQFIGFLTTVYSEYRLK